MENFNKNENAPGQGKSPEKKKGPFEWAKEKLQAAKERIFGVKEAGEKKVKMVESSGGSGEDIAKAKDAVASANKNSDDSLKSFENTIATIAFPTEAEYANVDRMFKETSLDTVARRHNTKLPKINEVSEADVKKTQASSPSGVSIIGEKKELKEQPVPAQENFYIREAGTVQDIVNVLNSKFPNSGIIVEKNKGVDGAEFEKSYNVSEIQKQLGVLNAYLETGRLPEGMMLPPDPQKIYPETGGIRAAVEGLIEKKFAGMPVRERVPRKPAPKIVDFTVSKTEEKQPVEKAEVSSVKMPGLNMGDIVPPPSKNEAPKETPKQPEIVRVRSFDTDEIVNVKREDGTMEDDWEVMALSEDKKIVLVAKENPKKPGEILKKRIAIEELSEWNKGMPRRRISDKNISEKPVMSGTEKKSPTSNEAIITKRAEIAELERQLKDPTTINKTELEKEYLKKEDELRALEATTKESSSPSPEGRGKTMDNWADNYLEDMESIKSESEEKPDIKKDWKKAYVDTISAAKPKNEEIPQITITGEKIEKKSEPIIIADEEVKEKKAPEGVKPPEAPKAGKPPEPPKAPGNSEAPKTQEAPKQPEKKERTAEEEKKYLQDAAYAAEILGLTRVADLPIDSEGRRKALEYLGLFDHSDEAITAAAEVMNTRLVWAAQYRGIVQEAKQKKCKVNDLNRDDTMMKTCTKKLLELNMILEREGQAKVELMESPKKDMMLGKRSVEEGGFRREMIMMNQRAYEWHIVKKQEIFCEENPKKKRGFFKRMLLGNEKSLTISYSKQIDMAKFIKKVKGEVSSSGERNEYLDAMLEGKYREVARKNMEIAKAISDFGMEKGEKANKKENKKRFNAALISDVADIMTKKDAESKTSHAKGIFGGLLGSTDKTLESFSKNKRLEMVGAESTEPLSSIIQKTLARNVPGFAVYNEDMQKYIAAKYESSALDKTKAAESLSEMFKSPDSLSTYVKYVKEGAGRLGYI